MQTGRPGNRAALLHVGNGTGRGGVGGQKGHAMRNVTLAIAGIAACTIGVVGGIAAHPTMKVPDWPDWRARYRAVDSYIPAPASPEPYALAEAGYAYDLAAADAYPRLPARPAHAPQAGNTAPLRLENPVRTDPDWIVAADPPQTPDEPKSGAAAVAAALAQTAEIGDAAAGLSASGAGDAAVGLASYP